LNDLQHRYLLPADDAFGLRNTTPARFPSSTDSSAKRELAAGISAKWNAPMAPGLPRAISAIFIARRTLAPSNNIANLYCLDLCLGENDAES